MAVSSLVRAALYLFQLRKLDREVTIRRRPQVTVRRCAVPTIASDHSEQSAAPHHDELPKGLSRCARLLHLLGNRDLVPQSALTLD